MAHFRKGRTLTGSYFKLQDMKIGPFKNIKKVGPDAYIIDLLNTFQILTTFNVANLHEYHPIYKSIVVYEDNTIQGATSFTTSQVRDFLFQGVDNNAGAS